MKTKIFFLLAILPFISCKKDCPDENTGKYGTGWKSDENYSQNIPVAINYGNYQGSSNLPASVDLTAKFPPIRDQGQLGTCVAWSVAYNTKSYLDGVNNNLSNSQLNSSANQYSPTDLFFSINSSRRNCSQGTFFEDAFEVLINRGVNNMSNVPYDQLCRNSSPGSASTASPNRIKNYRRIDGSVNQIKEYLAQGLPVVIGAMVNSSFQSLSGPSVLRDLTYTGDEGGHAMVIAGYDDSRNAFRIINSWGNNWGDNGYLWVDYNFLVNKFCVQGGQKSLFVAFNDAAMPAQNPPANQSGADLSAIVSSDFSMYPNLSNFTNARRAFFDIRNVGNAALPSNNSVNIYYLWVNAFNANNYGIIFRGEFNTGIPANSYQNVNSNYALINCELAAGASLAQQLIGSSSINWDYFMPQISGSYYLVMYIDIADANDANKTNNVFYVTQSPKIFNNGYSNRLADSYDAAVKYNFSDLSSFKHELSKAECSDEAFLLKYRSSSDAEFKNAYTTEEIATFLKNKIIQGGL